MKNIGRLIAAIDDFIEHVLKSFLFLFLFAMVAIILCNVFLRYVFRAPFYWAEDLSKNLMVWIGLIGSQIALKRGLHVGLSFFVDRLPFFISSLISFLVKLFLLIFVIILFKEGINSALFVKNQRWATLNISMFWVYVSVPTSSLFMAFTLIRQLFMDVQNYIWPFNKGTSS